MKSYFILATLCVFLWCTNIARALEVIDFVPEDYGEKECPIVRPVGCYKDSRKHRVMGHLLITDRDVYSDRFSGKKIDWNNFGVYIREYVGSDSLAR